MATNHFADTRRRAGQRKRGPRELLAGIALLGATLLPASLPAAPPDFARHWAINEGLSDEPTERLKGLALLREDATFHEPDPESPLRGMQQQYWEQLTLAEQRRRKNHLAEMGPLARILGARVLDIRADGDALVLTYDDGLTRRIAPRAGSPVYSAKGDEFVADGVGRSQAWWRGDKLVIETLLAPRGTMTEEISLDAAARLSVHTRISNPDWRTAADVVRVYDAVP